MNIVAVPINVNAVTTTAKVNNESPAPSLSQREYRKTGGEISEWKIWWKIGGNIR